ncbi:MAG: DEAD/DEAH box helicase family protein [Candidatus Thorarchaeota archaeon]
MWHFPDEVKFRFSWRPYQARVLSELEGHMGDKRLHVVAAPASGKTVLGLEVVRRLDGPTLVLAPTLAIRDQWVQRLEELFLPSGSKTPDWVSFDLARPGFFTVSTYQMLHAAMKREEYVAEPEEDEGLEDEDDFIPDQSTDIDIEEEEEQALDIEEKEEREAYNWLNQKRTDYRNAPMPELAPLLDQIGVKTVVLDEAHHLRSSWWKSLTTLIKDLGSIRLLALTATPPYDVPPAEWDRYIELCGPVDAEISVPELVKVKNLCPHQDLVAFSSPSFSEGAEIAKYREDVIQFVSDLQMNDTFIELIMSHEWLRQPESNLEDILNEPDLFTSMLVFLNQVGKILPLPALSLVTDSIAELPQFSFEWLELLLTGLFYPRSGKRPKFEPEVEEVRTKLRQIGAIERRKVFLRNPTFIEKILKRSVSKMDSIVDIANVEFGAYGDRLRMVILADYIRKRYLPSEKNPEPELDNIGVVPIFERLRRTNTASVKIGVLTGSLIIIPTESETLFRDLAFESGISGNDIDLSLLQHDEDYMMVKVLSSDKHKMVRVVTDFFSAGGLNILIGTKSLLGEGWDAPSINSLVISSVVGSFMLSNQMRGRAIRIQPGNPGKTANIWHLVCVEANSSTPGEDYNTLVRRFRAFVGVSQAEPLIENGLSRLLVGSAPYSAEEIWEINERMFDRSMQRDKMKESWEIALGQDQEIRLTEDVQFSESQIPTFLSSYEFPFWFPGCFGFSGLFLIGFMLAPISLYSLLFPLIPLLFLIPSLARHYRQSPLKRALGYVAYGLVASLIMCRYIRTPSRDLQINIDEGLDAKIYCHLKGANRREQSIFLQALQEIFNPIDDPRYLVCNTRPNPKLIADYYPVPKILGTKKEHATEFTSFWKRSNFTPNLIFTRNSKGRLQLLKARTKSRARLRGMKSERVTRWK